MKKLFIITGACGHLASTIIGYLKQKDVLIRGLILPTEKGLDDKNITYYTGDVTDILSLTPIFYGVENYETYVIHTAGIISIEKKISKNVYAVNVLGTKNIVSMCLNRPIKRLLYVSSVHAIKEIDGVISETCDFDKDAVVGGYASTKAEATKVVLDACKLGLDAVVVHPSGIIGPFDKGQNHIVQLIKMYISGKLPAGVSGGYDFVDVRDVAKGCSSAIFNGERANCYILSNEYFTVQQVLDYAKEVTGGKKKRCLPIWLAKCFTPLFTFIAKITKTRPLFTNYSLYTLKSNGKFSHEKATKKLNYKTTDMKTTIKDTISFLKGNKVLLDKI